MEGGKGKRGRRRRIFAARKTEENKHTDRFVYATHILGMLAAVCKLKFGRRVECDAVENINKGGAVMLMSGANSCTRTAPRSKDRKRGFIVSTKRKQGIVMNSVRRE